MRMAKIQFSDFSFLGIRHQGEGQINTIKTVQDLVVRTNEKFNIKNRPPKLAIKHVKLR